MSASNQSLRPKKSFTNLNVGLSNAALTLPSSITASLMLRTTNSHMLDSVAPAISPSQPESKPSTSLRKTKWPAPSRIPRPVIGRSPSSSSSTFSGLSYSGTDRRLSACTTPPTSPSVTSYARPTHASNKKSIDYSDVQHRPCPPPRRVLVQRQRDSISSLGTSYETPNRPPRSIRLGSDQSFNSIRSPQSSEQLARPMSYAAGMVQTPEYAALSRYGGLGVVVEGSGRTRPNLGHQSSAATSECTSVPESYMSMEEVRYFPLLWSLLMRLNSYYLLAASLKPE